jgi:hypothetical protein
MDIENEVLLPEDTEKRSICWQTLLPNLLEDTECIKIFISDLGGERTSSSRLLLLASRLLVGASLLGDMRCSLLVVVAPQGLHAATTRGPRCHLSTAMRVRDAHAKEEEAVAGQVGPRPAPPACSSAVAGGSGAHAHSLLVQRGDGQRGEDANGIVAASGQIPRAPA